MTFSYPRTVRFHETDGAGVVYFANILILCHEAYEASLAASGIQLKTFFSPAGIVVPVVHSSIDFFKPLHCGDRLRIDLSPAPLRPSEFQITYQIFSEPPEPQSPDRAAEPSANRASAQALTRHVCITAQPRKRTEIPVELQQWLTQWGS